MSNVYILEPPTSGKVLLKTTVGDIDVELWTKEAPRTCRNFIQLCLEGYYDNTIFHRVVKGFIAQGGDPNGDGSGGDSVYGAPFKDEFHQRLRFTRRGLLAMANAGKDDNGSQFFFTLGATPELQDKHTIFGKITGETIYNMIKLEEGLVKEERPVYPHKVLKTEVLNNPFTDIEPRVKEAPQVKEKKKGEKKKGVKNFKLLSFGAEAEEDEVESVRENEKFVGKGKSTHDVLDDPKLSSEIGDTPIKNDDDDDGDNGEEEQVEVVNPEVQLEKIRNKLKRKQKVAASSAAASSQDPTATYESFLEEERRDKKKKKYDEIQKEIETVKKEYHKNRLKKEEEKMVQDKKDEQKSETVKEYQDEYDKYKSKKDALPRKGAGREQFTLQLLEKFKNKLQSIKEKSGDPENEEGKGEAVDEDEAWLRHRLSFQENEPVLAKDANKKDDDWFEIYDPRSSLNKRKRGEGTTKFKK